MDIQTSWVTESGFADWVIDPSNLTVWVDELGHSVLDETGAPVNLVVDPGTGLSEGGDLVTAVLISLFTDAAAGPDDSIPDGSEDPRGWWAGQIGSRIWLRTRSKPTDTLLALVKSDIEDALKWLVTDGIATAIIVTTRYFAPGRLGAEIVISRRASRSVNLRFARLWES